MERLLGAAIGLARAVENNEHLITPETEKVLWETLAEAQTASPERTEELLERLRAAKQALVPMCFTCAAPCGRTADFDLARLSEEPEAAAGAKRRLLRAMCRMAGACGPTEPVSAFFRKALVYVGMTPVEERDLAALLREAQGLAGDLKFEN